MGTRSPVQREALNLNRDGAQPSGGADFFAAPTGSCGLADVRVPLDYRIEASLRDVAVTRDRRYRG